MLIKTQNFIRIKKFYFIKNIIISGKHYYTFTPNLEHWNIKSSNQNCGNHNLK